MAYYSLSQRTTNVTANAASWEIRAAAANKPRLIELGWVNNTNVSTEYSVGRPSQIGITPTAPQTFIVESDSTAPAGNTTAAVAWGTAPIGPSFFFRRGWGTGVGAGIIWAFPKGIDIPAGTSLVLWSLSVVAAADVWAVIDE